MTAAWMDGLVLQIISVVQWDIKYSSKVSSLHDFFWLYCLSEMPFQPHFHLHIFFLNHHHLSWLLLFPFLVYWVGLIFVVAVNTTCTTRIKINLFLLHLHFVLKKHSLGGVFYSLHFIGQALLKHAGHEAVLIECLGAQAYQDNLFTQLSPWFFYFSKSCWDAG